MTNGETQPNIVLLFIGGIITGVVSSLIAQMIYDNYKKKYIIKTAKKIIKRL